MCGISLRTSDFFFFIALVNFVCWGGGGIPKGKIQAGTPNKTKQVGIEEKQEITTPEHKKKTTKNGGR